MPEQLPREILALHPEFGKRRGKRDEDFVSSSRAAGKMIKPGPLNRKVV
jgi:hypothetical protein